MGAKNIGVVVQDPNTGEILAMDAGDRYDLNDPRDLSSLYSEEEIKAMNDEETVTALNAMWNNFCVTDAFEPGSVVKPIVMAGALEKGSIAEGDNFVCDGGQAFGANNNTFIKCAVYPDSHGTEDLMHVIANSCNDGMMQIAEKWEQNSLLKHRVFLISEAEPESIFRMRDRELSIPWIPWERQSLPALLLDRDIPVPCSRRSMP